MAHLNPLRPITYRLNSTPVNELPRYASHLAKSIANCSELIQGLDNRKGDVSIQIQKLITRTTSLLQDKTQEGRFTGIVLVKALIEASGTQSLASHGSVWVRGLLSCLSKQDPLQIKKLAILAITRMFLLTSDNQTMTREITTPSLPAFLTACLGIIKPTTISKDGVEQQLPSPLLQPVLQCWVQLIRTFRSTVRPFSQTIRNITLSLLSQPVISQGIKDVAMQVFSTLHFCAAKDASASEWNQAMLQIIEAAHQSSDQIFRSVIEEWSAVKHRSNVLPIGQKVSHEVGITDRDAVGMDRWVGMQEGCQRIVNLVQLIRALLSNPHAQSVNMPIAEIIDLGARLAAVLVPTTTYALRETKEVGREEREELFATLPRIHCALLQLYTNMAAIFGSSIIAISQPILSQVWTIFESESFVDEIRVETYKALREMLHRQSVLLHSSDTEHITSVARKCCDDLKFSNQRGHDSTTKSRDKKDTSLTLELGQTGKQRISIDKFRNDIADAAWNLLPCLLTHIPNGLVASSTRTEIERTAILIGHEGALLASVMNPPLPRKGGLQNPSLLPFLARSHNGELATEALIRPRMPVIQPQHSLDADEITDAKSEAEDEDEDMHLAKEPSNIISSISTTNTVTEHIENDSMMLNHDLQPAKKREHAVMEDTTVSTPVDTSKRARIESQSPNANIEAESRNGDGMDVNLDDTLGYKGIDNDEYHDDPIPVFTSREDKVQSGSVKGTVSADKPVSIVVAAVDDDSDDSEIPQIDTALSSDEEDDIDDEI